MIRVKICGITNLFDALHAVEAGADALGFVFAPSKRQINIKTAQFIVKELPPFVKTVGVFVNESLLQIQKIQHETKIDLIQLSGDESEDFAAFFGPEAIKTIHVREGKAPQIDCYPFNTMLLDTGYGLHKGGTGKAFDWKLGVAISTARRVILAGGLNPDNVVEAIKIVKPYAVDVSSGVEQEPGRKDHVKVTTFIKRAKSVDFGS